jgi:hypothetical protein
VVAAPETPVDAASKASDEAQPETGGSSQAGTLSSPGRDDNVRNYRAMDAPERGISSETRLRIAPCREPMRATRGTLRSGDDE